MTTYYTDNGARCLCGGTIYRYTPTTSGVMNTYCYTCHGTNYFVTDETPRDAADASRVHRDTVA